MKNTKRALTALLLAAALTVCGLTGCNSEESTDSKNSGNATSAASGTDSNSSGDHPLEKTSLNIGYLNSTAHLLAFVAQEEGYFAEEGFTDVNLIQTDQTMLASLEAGKFDMALMGALSAQIYQSQGSDITIFAGAMTNGHGYVIKSEYTGGKDNLGVEVLKGRNVASVKNSVMDYELRVLLKNANIEVGEGKDKVNIVYFANMNDAFAALKGNNIDSACVYTPFASLAKSQGYNVVFYCSDEEALQNQPCCRQVASTKFFKENPNYFYHLERAMLKAYKFSQENEEKTIQDIKKYIDIDESQINVEVYGGYSWSNPDPDKQACVQQKNDLLEFGYMEKDYDLEKLFDTEIYSEALDSLIAENPDDKIYKEQKEHFDKYE